MAKTYGASFTVGVEEEYQLVDPFTGELKSRAAAVLAADWTGEMRQEMQQNTVEVGTRPCRTGEELHLELSRLRLQAAVAAESRGLRVVAAGVHPFSHWQGQQYSPDPVYDRIRRDYRRLADSQNIFGLHIHVAVPPELDRVRLMNVLRHYLPHLLALSASSPVYLGTDSGYQSYRSILWSRWPRSGAPPRFRDAAAYDALIRSLIETGRIDSPGRIYWGMRPHHRYRTLEFRSADVPTRVEDSVGIAALARALTIAAAEGELAIPRIPEAVAQTYLAENLWSAGRDGLEAELVEFADGRARVACARESVARLAERLAPRPPDTADEPGWRALAVLLRRGNGAARIRERLGAGVDLPGLVSWLADETVVGVGLDRRSEQRQDA